MTKERIPVFLKHTLKSLRVRKGMGQKEASEVLHISEPTLRSWESDSSQLTYVDMQLVSSVYSIPQDYIFFGTTNAFSEKIKQEV